MSHCAIVAREFGIPAVAGIPDVQALLWQVAMRLEEGSISAAEMALRLKYAGVDPARITVVPELDAALDAALAGGGARVFALPTYTAMLALRDLVLLRYAPDGDLPRASAMTMRPIG